MSPENARKLRAYYIKTIMRAIPMAERQLDTHFRAHMDCGFFGVEVSDDKKTFKKVIISPKVNSEEGIEYTLDDKANPLHGSYHGAYLHGSDCTGGKHEHAMLKTLSDMADEMVIRRAKK